jgi:hypothetical protein
MAAPRHAVRAGIGLGTRKNSIENGGNLRLADLARVAMLEAARGLLLFGCGQRGCAGSQ